MGLKVVLICILSTVIFWKMFAQIEFDFVCFMKDFTYPFYLSVVRPAIMFFKPYFDLRESLNPR